ncbi:aminopeptidase N-like [Pogonomyrmex barbatus]|uniref:Aminopeptidase N-like n=1 Tax=Pogonomyrmex barbatus TaxID=144034 RepID=A0A6I9W246_9HYME|nr:aminopeptidase N-like [Pogonomyrmex barbatus]
MKVACIIARKMVQQFFNSLVDQSWFSPWLYEGLATFLGMQILNEIMPNYYIMELFVIQFQHESLRLNDYYDMPFVSNTDKPSDINSLFVFIRNIKAPVFIHILTQILPANVFTNGLNDYFANLRKFSFFNSLNNVDDTEMFFSVIQKILDDVDSTFDFKTRFSGWITQERYPLLNVTRELSRNMVEIKLSQKCLNISLKNLWIPVFYIILDAPNHVTPLSKYWLTTNKPVLRIADVNRNSWIIVNVQQSGYYRVYYDNHNWENVLKCLHSKHDLIPDLNRAQLINDAYYFLVRGELDFAIFKNLTSYLSHEILYISWYPMFKIMEEISAFFPFSQSRNIKKHFKLIFENVLEKKLNYEVLTLDNVLTKSLRQEATRWTCILNSSKCMDFATLTLSGHLNKAEPHSLLPWLGKEWTYCSGLMMANDTVWNDVFNTRKTDKKILEFLACTKNHTIIFGYIDRLKSGYFTEIRDYITIFHSIIAKHAKDNLVLDYILEKFIYFRKFILYPSDNNLIVALTDIINHVYSTEQLNKVSDFAKKIIIPEIMTHIHRKIETRMSEIEKHINYFENFLKTE